MTADKAVTAETLVVFALERANAVNAGVAVPWVSVPVEEPELSVGPAIGPPVIVLGVVSLASRVIDVVPVAISVPASSVVISRSNVPSKLSIKLTPAGAAAVRANTVSLSNPSEAPVVVDGSKSVSSIRATGVPAAVLVVSDTLVVLVLDATAVGVPIDRLSVLENSPLASVTVRLTVSV